MSSDIQQSLLTGEVGVPQRKKYANAECEEKGDDGREVKRGAKGAREKKKRSVEMR